MVPAILYNSILNANIEVAEENRLPLETQSEDVVLENNDDRTMILLEKMYSHTLYVRFRQEASESFMLMRLCTYWILTDYLQELQTQQSTAAVEVGAELVRRIHRWLERNREVPGTCRQMI